MSSETHQNIIDFIPAYALGALDEDEAIVVENHLKVCESCRLELSHHQDIVDSLPLASTDVDPSPMLKRRLMAQIQAKKPVVREPPRMFPNMVQWWRATISQIYRTISKPSVRSAIALASIIILFGIFFIWQQTGSNRIEMTATDSAPTATGTIEIAANGVGGRLTVTGLPNLSPDEQYQLWLIEEGQRTSGAVFSVSDDGSAVVSIVSERPLSEFGAFGITIEPAGGSPGPTGKRVLGYNL